MISVRSLCEELYSVYRTVVKPRSKSVVCANESVRWSNKLVRQTKKALFLLSGNDVLLDRCRETVHPVQS